MLHISITLQMFSKGIEDEGPKEKTANLVKDFTAVHDSMIRLYPIKSTLAYSKSKKGKRKSGKSRSFIKAQKSQSGPGHEARKKTFDKILKDYKAGGKSFVSLRGRLNDETV